MNREERKDLESQQLNEAMYLLWHSDLKAPIVIDTKEELMVYIQLMRTLGKGTPRWVEMPPEYFEGMDI